MTINELVKSCLFVMKKKPISTCVMFDTLNMYMFCLNTSYLSIFVFLCYMCLLLVLHVNVVKLLDFTGFIVVSIVFINLC